MEEKNLQQSANTETKGASIDKLDLDNMSARELLALQEKINGLNSQQNSTNQQQNAKVDSTALVVATMNKKSVGLSFILTFLFGPLGLFYASISRALIMIFFSIVTLAFIIGGGVSSNLAAGGFGFILAIIEYILCLVFSVTCVNSYNNELLNMVTGKE